MKVTLIAAIGAHNELGKDNQLLWRLPSDMKRFKEITTGHCIIMGRKTFESLGRALPNRTTIVISRKKNPEIAGVIYTENLKQAFIVARKHHETHCFVIGGGQIYTQALAYADTLDITHVHHRFEADVFFPTIDTKKFVRTYHEEFMADEKNNFNYSFTSYQRIEKRVPALFLDRDGVLNREIGGYITSMENFSILENIAPFLKRKQKEGFKLIVITNQGALEKEMLTLDLLQQIHTRMVNEYAALGVTFDEIYYCPHHHERSNCLCRKPKSLMVEKAIARFHINPNESIMIGDHERDRHCAEGAGVLGMVINSNDVNFISF